MTSSGGGYSRGGGVRYKPQGHAHFSSSIKTTATTTTTTAGYPTHRQRFGGAAYSRDWTDEKVAQAWDYHGEGEEEREVESILGRVAGAGGEGRGGGGGGSILGRVASGRLSSESAGWGSQSRNGGHGSLYNIIVDPSAPSIRKGTIATAVVGLDDDLPVVYDDERGAMASTLTLPDGLDADLEGTATGIFAMSTAVLILLIVASVTAIVALIYVIIYFKSIKPMSARSSRGYVDQRKTAGGGSGGGVKGGGGEEGGRGRSAHPFFRRS